VQLADVGAPGVPALVQEGLVVIELAGPPGQRARHDLIDAGRAVVAAGGPGCQAQLPHDRGDVFALVLQRLDLFVALAGPHHPGPVLSVGGARLGGELPGIGSLLRGGLLQGGVVLPDAPVVGGDGLLDVPGQVVP
jgi:hypothetical protein